MQTSIISTYRGRRDFMFPSLPAALSTEQKKAVCYRFANEALVSQGMACEVTLWRTGAAQFSCPTRRLEENGFGEVASEWGTPEFSRRVKAAFAEIVNDALEAKGRARSYAFL